MESRERAETAAAAWIAKRESEEWNEATQGDLDAWIAECTDNRVAWLRLSTAWNQTSRLKSLVSTAPRGAVPKPNEVALPFFQGAPAPESPARKSRSTWFRRPRGSVAACIVVALVAAGTWKLTTLFRGDTYETDVGALQAVPMPDGSRVTLNTNTRVRIVVNETARTVTLDDGEAYFDVARDPSRPFVVNVAQKRIVVLGTQFSVRRDGNAVRVAVNEGKVRIEQAGGPTTRPMTQLTAGDIARAGAEAVVVEQKPVEQVERLLSWRTGHLSFDGTTLAEAVAEFNRYNTRKIVIDDPGVAGIRVGGDFRATNIDAFVRLIASDFPIRVTQRENQIILTGTTPPH